MIPPIELNYVIICKFAHACSATIFRLFTLPSSSANKKWYVRKMPLVAVHHSSVQQSYGGYSNGHSSHGGYGGGGGGGGWGGHDDRMSNLGGGLRTVDWTATKLERFEKNFYVEDKRVTARSEKEVEEYRRANEIKVCMVFQRLLFTHFRRFKVATFLDRSPHSRRLDSLSTSWRPSGPRAFQRQPPSNAKHGPWPSAEEMWLPSRKLGQEKPFPSRFLLCFISMRKFSLCEKFVLLTGI